ncbi:hypothetical protein ACHAXN_009739 [Cyclotella atomus]
MKSIAPLLIFPFATSAQQITGTIFQDYNSNGIRDVNSPGFYEGGAANIPIELHACQDDIRITTYSNDTGAYLFNVIEGCYYIYMGDYYNVGPYVEPGEVTQMMTNEVYPGSRKSVEGYVSDGEEIVWNVGIVSKSAVAAVEETSTTSTETVSSSEITTSSSVAATENYSEAFFSVDDDNDDNATDIVDTDDFSDVIDSVENSTDVFDVTTAVDVVDALDTTTMATAFAAVEETVSNVDAETLFEGDVSETAAVEPTTAFWGGGDTNTSSIVPSVDAAVNDTSTDTSSTSSPETASVNETSNITAATVESDTTVTSDKTNETNVDEEVVNADEETSASVSVQENSGGKDQTSTKKPTSSPTKSETDSKEDEQSNTDADKSPSKDTGKESSDVTVSTSDEESTGETVTSKPTKPPTAKPTTCIGCELSLQAKVRIQLDNIEAALSDDSKSLFESVCTSFLEEQLSIATPPISDLNCVVVEESFEAQSSTRSRFLRSDGRKLSQLYLADVKVTGSALSTQSHQTPESIKFKELCVGTFTVQGFLFVRALKEAEEESSSDVSVFQSVENARGVMTYDASEATSGEQIDDPSNPDGESLSTGVLAAIAAGSVFCAVCFLAFIAVKARNKRKNKYSYMDERNQSAKTNKSAKNVDSTIYGEFPELRPSPTNSDGTGHTFSSRPSPTNSQGSGPTITPVSIRSNAEEVEVDMIPSTFSGDSKVASVLNSRVRRDLQAPPGKLGIMVANTAGFGPAVHTLRDSSPMAGLIFVNDIIIAINDTDTREFTATQITQMMKDTVDQERKITVLSSVR